MTCPGPDPELCCDMTPCPSCHRATTVNSTPWHYTRRLGWHAPAEACPAVLAAVESSVTLGLSGSDMTEPEVLATPRAPESTDPTQPEGTPYG